MKAVYNIADNSSGHSLFATLLLQTIQIDISREIGLDKQNKRSKDDFICHL